MICTDMETWLSDCGDRIYRFLVYKKLFTPYEQEQKFTDESQFEDTHYRFGIIEEVIELGNSEWLLGFREIVDHEMCGFINYFKLNDIQLSYFEQDRDMLNPEDSEEDE